MDFLPSKDYFNHFIQTTHILLQTNSNKKYKRISLFSYDNRPIKPKKARI